MTILKIGNKVRKKTIKISDSGLGYPGGFTLVELMAAAAVISVGMVFVLGAFSQCINSMATAEKTIIASDLLNKKIQEINADYIKNGGSQEGFWSGEFGDEANKGFNWTQAVGLVLQDFGNDTVVVQGNINEETVSITWKQGKAIKDVSVTRFVKRKKP